MEPLSLPEVTNIAGVGALHELLRERLGAADKAPLTVDCSAVRSIDAASLQCLLIASRDSADALSLRARAMIFDVMQITWVWPPS